MKRRILSVAIAILILTVSVIPGLSALAAGTVPTLSGGVYQIGTASELIWFADAVNSGSQSIKGKLTADIQLNAPGSVANKWTPIGTQASPFRGTFDGDGHTVSGVYVDSGIDCAGFFGSVVIPSNTSGDADAPDKMTSEYVLQHTQTSIKNIKITNAEIHGGYSVGGIVGYAENLGLSDCSFEGDVYGSGNSIGGIVGWAYYYTVINQCYSSGTVSGNQRVGGIAGYANGNSVIVKSYSDMAVSGKLNVGGVGGTLSGAFLEGCFFLGSVSADDTVGGLVGYALFSTVCDAYAIAPVTSTGKEVGGTIGSVYGSECDSNFYSYETSGVDGTAGVGRTLADMKLSAFVKELNGQKAYFCFDYTEINNGYPVLAWMLSLDVWAGDRSVPQKNSSGTYLISKPSELAWFAALVNGQLNGMDANPNANATVTDNLLMNINVNDDSFGVIEWTPIGIDEAHGYNGIFNGGGYNIAGLYTSSSSGDSGRNIGLFGYINTGTVTNTVVLDGRISGIENVGGIAGYLKSGSILNCAVDSEVSGDKAVGGIVGNLGGSTASVSTSSMLGSIVGTNYSNDKSFLTNVGGVVGISNKATVNKCFNYATISAPNARFVGGILGYNSAGTLTNSYSTAAQTSGNVMVGGLVGYNNNGTVKTCYVSSKVTGSSQVGVAFGNTVGANVSSIIFDGTYKTNLLTTGATEKTPAQMTGSSSVSNIGFSSSDWRATADDTYFYYYPQLTSMYNMSSVKVIKDGSVRSVKRVQDKYVAKVQIDGRTDTYYETVAAAIDYASNTSSTVLPSVYVIRDTELASTVNITSGNRNFLRGRRDAHKGGFAYRSDVQCNRQADLGLKGLWRRKLG
ncbi:MAG: GLUG motif-containing protein [Acutalibacteraceae bacterium]|nr:GLUG motif-containing protein [Acutalibacteraceae bacterium]